MKIIVYILLILITYGGIASANSGNWGTGATLLITTVAPFYPTYSAGESTSESTEDIARWFGDLDEKFACLSKIKISDVTFFAIENFDQMQQEQFYMDKPYIDAFSELTAISSTDIETLLANNQSATESFTARPAMFVSAVVQKMTIDIMSSDMSYEAKREKLSEILLIMDDDISEAIDDNDLDDLLDIASCKPKIEKVLNSYSAFERTSTIYANGVEIGMSDLESYYYYGQLRFERTREYEKEYDKRIFRYYSNRGELELETTFSYTGDGYRYDENSNIKGIDERGYYRSGVLKWEASFVYPDAPDEDEALRYDYEIPYKGQFIDGITKEYYENGVLRQESVGYEAGILNGYRQQYYESGIVKSNTQIQNNKRHGEHKAYNEDGSLRYIIIYKDDKFVNGSCMIGSLKQDNEEYFCIN